MPARYCQMGSIVAKGAAFLGADEGATRRRV